MQLPKRSLRPPRNFFPAGAVEFAELALETPPFIKRQRHTGVRAQGVRYERKAQGFLERQSVCYVPGPWLRFAARGDRKLRWCQPDGLYFDFGAGRITVVEIKYKHTELAWWQIRQLYGPVVAALFPGWAIGALEVCHWFDPAVGFPEAVCNVGQPFEEKDRGCAFYVYVYKGKAHEG
ncbi:MAG: hypothetical protein OXL41_03955 [Nitrospinae bacterium]|nr:hypothetical protein [Nitrospinota bacterium]